MTIALLLATGQEPTLGDPARHWAFHRPAPPPVPGDGHPVDAFLAAAHRARGLTPAPPAPKNVLLRRVTFDLTGLPPTREELHAFLADDSPDAYERAVDRLLDSTAYGERWARHWMDVWRYADWSGENTNLVRSSPLHIWRWRDWIVESVNRDKGYDRMILEMLAGDELAPQDPDALRATGFLARNWYPFNRNVWLDDTVEHTAKAFLALTFDCARCHDHKYDPISQKDYYRFRSFFEPHDVRTDPVPGLDPKTEGLVRVYDARPEAPTYLFRRGDETKPDLENPLSPGLPEILGGSVPIRPAGTSTGRRLALARWIADGRNPLTARVAVNHVWTRHFGAPLAGSVTDFGVRTARPALGDLLDWLAVRFVEGGWSLKKLHRLIVTSAAYRRRSGGGAPPAETLSADPDNRLLWRMNAWRLEAEAVRDALLHAAGSLDRTAGGKEIPFQEGESNPRRSLYFRHGHERQMKFLLPFDAADVLECYQRTTTVIPQQALALMNGVLVRDQARVLAGKITPQVRSDEEFVARAFEHVLSRLPSPEESGRCRSFLDNLARVLSKPLAYESKAPGGRVAPSGDPAQRARENLVHVLMNHNDFITVR
jgi:hypothetical protein